MSLKSDAYNTLRRVETGMRIVERARMGLYGLDNKPTRKRKKSIHAGSQKADAGNRRRAGEVGEFDQQSRAAEIQGAGTGGPQSARGAGSNYRGSSSGLPSTSQPGIPYIETPAERKRRIARERLGL